MYDPVKSNHRFSDVYEESKKLAEKKIREKEIELKEFELASLKSDDDIDLSIDEFEEIDEVGREPDCNKDQSAKKRQCHPAEHEYGL